MADREGFLVIDEVAAVGMMTSTMNFVDAAGGKPTAFFRKETTPRLLENHLAAVDELIRRDKNHACIIAWCLANEPETTDENALPYFAKVFERAHELDPQKRPRTFTSIIFATPDKCTCVQLCDIVCLNRYYGWYVKGGYEISDAENWMRGELEGWKKKCQGKPFVFTEYGADTDSGLHKLPSVMWSQEYQYEYLEMCHRVFDSFDFIRGEQVWNFADFQTTEGIMRVDGNKKGIFTRNRQLKETAGGLFSAGLIALAAYLKGRCRVSFRALRDFFQEAPGIAVSRRFPAKQIGKAGVSLKRTHEELAGRLKREGHPHINGSGWKERGEKRRVWVFRAERYAVFIIRGNRWETVPGEVLGKKFKGIISCDFYGAYRKYRRAAGALLQFCRARFIREVLFLLKPGDAAVRRYGKRILKQARLMFRTIRRKGEMAEDAWKERMRDFCGRGGRH
jgi:hypothetical protein